MTIYKGHYKGNLGVLAFDDPSQLLTVSGELYVCQDVTADAPKLTKVLLGVRVGCHAVANVKALTVAGFVNILEGGTLNAPALKRSTRVYVCKGGVLNAPNLDQYVEIFHEIACSKYALFASQKRYQAGCRGPWTAEKALAHWGPRTDERAKLFVEAIKANEKRKSK